MSANEIRVGDIGTILEVTLMDDAAVVDISSATTTQFKLKKPGGTTVTKTAVFTTDGTDGKLRYTTLANDLDEAGSWDIQTYLVMTGWTGHSDIGDLYVYANL